jgi:GMP synthase (glutamine-hydrolysing)
MYLIINNSYGTEKAKATPKLINYFKKNNIPHSVINTKKQLVKYIDNYSILGIILSGSDLSYADKVCSNQININIMALLEFNVPVLGICFGFQTLGLFYGGTIAKLSKLNKGKQEIKLKRNELFYNINNFEFYQYHNDYLKEVPYNFSVIAVSDKNIVNGIKHKYKPIYGVQFHPELSGNSGEQILENFMNICSIY